MCVVIAKPKGVQIRKKYLRNCYLSNPDGAGFMFVRDGEIIIRKGYFSFELFYIDYEKAEQENTKSPFVIHFRIATSGGVNLLNCHPFKIDEYNAFAHNGIFYTLPYTAELSDTQIFNNRILKNLPTDWMEWSGITKLVDDYIQESGSKVVFLGSNKALWICGEDNGNWFKGTWYSNSSYLDVQKVFQQSYGFNQEYLRKYPDNSNTGLVELDPNGTECEECHARVSSLSVTYLAAIGTLCLDCAEEYQLLLESEK